MNVPNLITIARLFIAFTGFLLMIFDQWLLAAVLILVAVLMDVADGRMARRLNQVTKQGVFLDVMADKIVIISTFLIIGVKINIIFFYLGILMLVREYTMDTMRSIAASQNKVISADKFSKIKGIIFMSAMLGMLWFKALNLADNLWQNSFIILASIGMIMAYITLVRFFIKYKDLLLSK